MQEVLRDTLNPLKRVESVTSPLTLVLFLTLVAFTAEASDIFRRVVGTSDGDTLTVLDESNHQTKVRLAEIDTPESAHFSGSRAKQELSALVFGKTVMAKVIDRDRYGRTVGRVFSDTVDIMRKWSAGERHGFITSGSRHAPVAGA